MGAAGAGGAGGANAVVDGGGAAAAAAGRSWRTVPGEPVASVICIRRVIAPPWVGRKRYVPLICGGTGTGVHTAVGSAPAGRYSSFRLAGSAWLSEHSHATWTSSPTRSTATTWRAGWAVSIITFRA